MSDYEAERQANIEANRQLMASLGIQRPKSPPAAPVHPSSSARKRKSVPFDKRAKSTLPPARKSARISALPAPEYDPDALPPSPSSDDPIDMLPGRRREIRQLPRPASPPAQTVDEEYDGSYRSPRPGRDVVGEGEGKGTFRFDEGFEGFTPNVSPEEMMREGMFGGMFFRAVRSQVLKKDLPADYDRFPQEWYEGLDVDTYLAAQEYDPEINAYKVKASQSLQEWEKAGWIKAQDPRGWAEWYFHFWLGRRTSDDARQIQRWASAVGPRGRFKTSLAKSIVAASSKDPDAWKDPTINPVKRQTCFHWAVEFSKIDQEAYAGI